MEAVLTILAKDLPLLLLLFFVFGGTGATALFMSWVRGYNERKFRAQKHQQDMEKLQAKQNHEFLLAERTEDAIKLLALDPKFGEDFDRRLRVALGKQEEDAVVVAATEEAEAVEEEVRTRRASKSTRRRR